MAFLLELAIRTTLVACGTALVLRLSRIQTAAVRHAAWTGVVIVMLGLPAWTAGGARVPVAVLTPPADSTQPPLRSAAQAVAPAIDYPASSDQAITSSSVQPNAPAVTWPAVLISLYAAVALLLLGRLAMGTAQANRLRRRATLRDGRLTSDDCTTPITVGWLRPALILPSGWDRWSAAKRDAVFTHETEHARRRDPLVQWLALLNRALFWFHPLAWWLERRLATLSEEACDAAVLAAGHSPQHYSAYLLEMARAVTRGQGRVHFVGMAMPGHGLSGRLRQIFHGLPSARVSRTRAIGTIACCAISSVLFSTAMLATRAQAPGPGSSSDSAMRIQFEAVSIRPCESSGPTNGRGGGGMRNAISPGYASWGCVSLAQLVDQAYGGGPFPKNALLNTIRTPPGERPDLPKRIRGGPSWVEDEKFAIEIRLSGDTTTQAGPQRHDAVLTAMAPALRAMLEDRFQLKLRKATEERPMYALTVKTGFAMTVSAPEKCWNPEDYPRPPGLSRMELPPPPPGWEGIPACGYQAQGGRQRGNEFTEFRHIDLASFAGWLSQQMDRYVLDKTSTPGRYSFRLEFAPDEHTPGITERSRMFARAGEGLLGRTPPAQEKGDGPTIFKALDALGFRLESTRGPAEYLLIDSAQRPTPGGPGPAGS
jgi:uncharacterized protein (TIGR03435 family)